MNNGKRLLITGIDGSLGSKLAEMAAERNFEVFGLTMAEAEDAPAARAAVRALPEDPTHLILCHSVNHLSLLGIGEEKDDAMHERMMRANILVPRAVVSTLAETCSDVRALFITSQTHRVPQRATSMYCATKAAQTMLMRVAARELAASGWVVNALAPGKIVDTKMSQLTDTQVQEIRGWTTEEADGYALSLIPAARFTTREEVATAAFRILGMPSYINGTTIDMTGGV